MFSKHFLQKYIKLSNYTKKKVLLN